MEFQGKVIFVGEEKSGTAQATGKAWRRNEFVVETHEQYPKKCCFITFNDTCSIIPPVGEEVKVSFDVDAREYNGRWYNDIKAYKIERAGDAALNAAVSQQATPQPQQTVQPGVVRTTDAPIAPKQAEQPQQEALPF